MKDIWPDMSHLERDAHYQAGCAIVALRESLEVIRIYIDDDEGHPTSWIDVTHPNLSHRYLSRSATAQFEGKAVIRSLLAGPAALLRYSFGTYPRDCPLPEFNLADPWMAEQEAVWRAISLAGKISKDSPSLLRCLWKETNSLLQGDTVWPAIEAVAQVLLITGELAGCEIGEIARHTIGPN
jgi:hypothetical protein